MAVRIDRVEREFILGSAAESRMEARIRTAGKSVKCRLNSLSAAGVGFSTSSPDDVFALREQVSVCFDFRGQSVAFDARVIRAASGLVELALPEAMYRSLSRRWPRVSPPKDLSVQFLLSSTELTLHCPESRSWEAVELPELREGLDPKSLASLIDSFRAKASEMASEGRVIMYKERGPVDVAEEIAATYGRVLYCPSSLGPLPAADPYPAGRIITQEMAEEFESPSASAQGSRLATYLQGRAVGGLNSGLWCPVVYYHYAVGMVIMTNTAGRQSALDYAAVDLAWEFSRVLAWFLKRHGYFAGSGVESGLREGGIIDASPAGLLLALPDAVAGKGNSDMALGVIVRLKLSIKGKSLVCTGKIARRFQENGSIYCGIAFTDLSARDMAGLSLSLYGEDENSPSGGF